MLNIRRYTRSGALIIAPVLAAGIAWAGSTKKPAAQKPAACAMTGQHQCGAGAVAAPKSKAPAKAACPMTGKQAKDAAACKMDPATCRKMMESGECHKAQGACPMTTGQKASTKGAAHPAGCPMLKAQKANAKAAVKQDSPAHPAGCPMKPTR